MIDLSNARLLARYRLWADQLTFDAVAALPPPARNPTTDLPVYLRTFGTSSGR